MTGWDFVNSERKRLGIRPKWKTVSTGEVHGQLTALNDGRGKEWVRVFCSCGSESKFTAAAIKGGRVTRCAKCDAKADADLVWTSPRKWVNRKLTAEDREIIRIREAKLKKKHSANENEDG